MKAIPISFNRLQREKLKEEANRTKESIASIVRAAVNGYLGL